MRAIIMINPNNPTGSVVTDAELDAVAAIAREHDLALISDEVFADYPISGAQPASALRQQTALTFALGGLSKSVGLPQVKLGWIAVGGPSRTRRRRDGAARNDLRRLSVGLDAGAGGGAGAAERRRVRSSADSARACVENSAELSALAAAHPACAVLPVEAGWYAVVQVPAVAARRDDRARPARANRRARASGLLLRFRTRGVPRPQPASRAASVCFAAVQALFGQIGARR